MSTESIAEEYVRLALAIGQHLPGYIDAYFGPREWKAQAEREDKRPLPDLARRASELGAAVATDASLDAQRQDFLACHVRAMQASLRLLSGEKMALAEEAEQVYDIRPAWIDEVVFEEAQRELDGLLPPGNTLLERLTNRKQALMISTEKARELLPLVHVRLREAARARFPLPEDESLEFEFVSGHPWFAYNWYLGGGRSRIEINTDLPMQLTRLVKTIAHEAYPGHHTELAIKDSRLLQKAGELEHSVIILNSPSCVVAEGIATCALSVIMPDDVLEEWYETELMPRAGLDLALARGEPAIARTMATLDSASDNAAFMLHDRGADPGELLLYLQKFELFTEQEARKRIEFLRDPLDRSYIFTYDGGRRLLLQLFALKGDVTQWFTRLLTEAVTPSQIRGWMGE